MDDETLLASDFEAERPHLRAVAYRMLGSFAEADDAVQEAWLRLAGTDAAAIDNLPGWLTTVVSRICLDVLRRRSARPDAPTGALEPDPVVSPAGGLTPEDEALLADTVGLARAVVLDTLGPAERVAYVLHDIFALPFDDVASIVGRSAAATRQLASRARRRVEGRAPVPDVGLPEQRRVVDAFFAASRAGDIDALVAVLDPDVVLRSDGDAQAGGRVVVHGAEAVAGQAMRFSQLSDHVRPALVNGIAGVVVAPAGRPQSVMAFTVVGGRIVAIDSVSDRARLGALPLPDLPLAGGGRP